MRKSLVAFFVVLLLVSLVSAVDWTPQGDINLRNIYGIESVTTINITGFLCFNESCFNATNLSASTGGDMTTVIGSDGVQGGATSGVAILYTNWTRHNEVYINNSIFNRTVSESVNYTSVDGNLSIDSGSNVITWLIDLITKASELANDMGWVNSTIIQGWIGSNSTADRTYTDDSISSNITALDIGQYATNTDVENNVTVLVARDDAINDSLISLI